MFGILDIIFLILVRRRNCKSCGRAFWAAPPHTGRETAVGRESYLCVCGDKYETGRREWAHLDKEEKRKYLWSGLSTILFATTVLAAIGGYFLRWHEPYWTMSVILGFLGLLSGLICCAVLLGIRSLPVAVSWWRTRHDEPTLGDSQPLEELRAVRFGINQK